jgi:two-component system, LuxR family, response regulator FixJ
VSGAAPWPRNKRATVFVVDDDEAMRESLAFLLKSLGLEVCSFASAQDFLARYSPPVPPACLLLDVRMPGMSGLDLQAVLKEHRIELSVIMITAYADVPMAVRAMHQGAVDFLEKPFNEQQLFDCIQKAIACDLDQQRTQEIRDRMARLTPRELEVMQLVVLGLLNKQIARELTLSMKTVEQHRARVMEKMGADSLASLVRMALSAGLA